LLLRWEALAVYWVLLRGIAGSAQVTGWYELGRIVAEIEG
jgi:hypothetical protein